MLCTAGALSHAYSSTGVYRIQRYRAFKKCLCSPGFKNNSAYCYRGEGLENIFTPFYNFLIYQQSYYLPPVNTSQNIFSRRVNFIGSLEVLKSRDTGLSPVVYNFLFSLCRSYCDATRNTFGRTFRQTIRNVFTMLSGGFRFSVYISKIKHIKTQ